MNIFSGLKSSGWLPAIFIAAMTILPINANAQSVVLQSKTGNVKITGKLVEFDGEFYRVETDLGVMTVDGRTVNCTGEGCPSAQDLMSKFTVVGAGRLGQTLVPALLDAFSLSLDGTVKSRTLADEQTLKIQDDLGTDIAEVAVLVRPDAVAFEELAKGGNVFVAVSRMPTKPEQAAIKKAKLGDLSNLDQQQILAIDGIVATVSMVNPLDNISLAKLRKVLTGDITNWRDIGGPDADIDLYLPKENAAFDAVLESSLLGIKPAQLAKSAQRLDGLAAVADAAAENPFAIGLTSFSNLRDSVALGLKGNCGIYSRPSVFTLKSGGYPLRYAHYIFRPKLRLPIFAREFLDFATSDQAQNVIRDLGYADLGISALSLDHQGFRLVNAIGQAGKEVPVATLIKMVRLQNGAKRLSTTFRFLPGSKKLDTQSLQNAALLASGLILGNYADKQVHLIGFTDAAGGSKQNISLAQKRAKTVLKAVIAAAPDGSLDDVDFQTSGFGEASPLACEDTEAGKQVNRRVEIWIKDN